jgi:tetratricopeptide (TPR) repeat protein
LEKTKEQLLDEAVKYYEEECYEEALKTCQRAISNYPTYARAFHGKGLILIKQKKYREALVAYNTACELDKGNAKAYSERGALLFALEDFYSSRQSYIVAMRLNKKYEEVYKRKTQDLVNRAKKLCKQDSLNKSITALEHILAFDPNNEFAKSNLKELQRKKKLEEEVSSQYFGETSPMSFRHGASVLDPPMGLFEMIQEEVVSCSSGDGESRESQDASSSDDTSHSSPLTGETTQEEEEKKNKPRVVHYDTSEEILQAKQSDPSYYAEKYLYIHSCYCKCKYCYNY